MKTTTKALVGLAATAPVLLAVPVLAIGAGMTSPPSSSCAASDAQGVDAAAVASQVKSILDGGNDKKKVSVPGLPSPAEQVPLAKTIQATGVAMNVPARGQVVALATALQESGLRNLRYGDRDSLGLFQQRPSQGWGTAEQILDPVHASTKFYEALKKVSGWESVPVAQAAQAVQRSGFPDAYAKWEPLATALQQAIEPLLAASGDGPEDSGEGAAADTADSCPADGDEVEIGDDFGGIPPGRVPDGYSVPAHAPAKVRKAIRWALAQLGTPYQWGGSCTAAHGLDLMGRCDCSSLMQQAYKAGGVTLERTTYGQVKAGKSVSVGSLRPGDLVFTEGTAKAPEHVGMAIGHGLIIHAPHTGDVVRIVTVASWKSQILAARRLV
ncbi:C40 family peptidase [Streptomyces sp. NPDC057521]|uniref:C40 family peptidase n=1 Tax=Streptomyces sp. NPDC057521 TaxID=3346156 RepID=UPI00367B29E7